MPNNIQSSAESKARKALLRLGLKPVNGVERVALTVTPYRKLYAIRHPEVFKSDNSDTYIVFGELTFENDTNVETSSLYCEQTFTVIKNANVEKEGASAGTTDTGDSQEVTEEEETVDIFAIEEEDIQIVIQQSHTTRVEAIEALICNENDVINAIMNLTL